MQHENTRRKADVSFVAHHPECHSGRLVLDPLLRPRSGNDDPGRDASQLALNRLVNKRCPGNLALLSLFACSKDNGIESSVRSRHMHFINEFVVNKVIAFLSTPVDDT